MMLFPLENKIHFIIEVGKTARDKIFSVTHKNVKSIFLVGGFILDLSRLKGNKKIFRLDFACLVQFTLNINCLTFPKTRWRFFIEYHILLGIQEISLAIERPFLFDIFFLFVCLLYVCLRLQPRAQILKV